MIGHIFRKDCRLMWPMAVAVAVLNIAEQLHWLYRDIDLGRIDVLVRILPTISLLATGFLIVMVVHQDALPGMRQDWLTRPIRRRDVLLAKLLFVVLLVQVPVFVGIFVSAAFAELPIQACASAALWRSLWMLLDFDLPLIALAAVTSGLRQVIAGILAAVVGMLALGTVLSRNPYINHNLMYRGIPDTLQLIWCAAGAFGVVILMYRTRKAIRMRWILAGAVVIWVFIAFMPTDVAFALESRLSSHPATGAAGRIEFDPLQAKQSGMVETTTSQFRGHRGSVPADLVYLPMRVEGLEDGGAVYVDRMVAHWSTNNGDTGDAEVLDLPAPFLSYQMVSFPAETFKKIKDRSLRLELNYWLTLFEPGSGQEMPAIGGDTWMTGLGRCKSSKFSAPDSRVNAIAVDCVGISDTPITDWSMASARGRLNRIAVPYFWTGNPPFRFSGNLPNYFHHGIALRVPIPESELKDARVMVRIYRPQPQITRSVVIPQIRLADWRN